MQEYKTASKCILPWLFSPGKLVLLQVSFQSWLYGRKYQLKKVNPDFLTVFKNWLISGHGRNYPCREHVRTANHHRKTKRSGYWEEDGYQGKPNAIFTWEMRCPNHSLLRRCRQPHSLAEPSLSHLSRIHPQIPGTIKLPNFLPQAELKTISLLSCGSEKRVRSPGWAMTTASG